MAIEWFCKIAGKEFGPLSAAELRAMVAEGSLTPNHSVRPGREGAWSKASQVKGLFNGAEEAEWTQSADKLEPKPAEKPTEKPLLRAKAMPAAKPAPSHEVRPLHATPAAPVPPVLPAAPPGVPVGMPVGQVPMQPMPRHPAAAPQPAPAYAYVPAPAAAHGHRSSGADEASQLGKRRKKNNTLFVVGLCGVLLAAVVGIAALALPRGDEEPAKQVARKTNDKETDSDPFKVKKSDEPAEAKPGEPAAETPPAEWKGEVKWVDAKAPIRRGDVEVRVVLVGQGKPVLLTEKNPSEKRSFRSPMLVVKLELANVGGTGKATYKPWSYQYTGVILKDNAGRLIPATQFRKRGLVAEGQQIEASTTIEEKIEDVLVFDLPKERFKHLRLLLPATALGQQEPLGFEISPAMIREIESPRRPSNDPDALDPAGLGRTQDDEPGRRPDEGGKPAPVDPDKGIPGVTGAKDPLTQLREAEAALEKEGGAKKEQPE